MLTGWSEHPFLLYPGRSWAGAEETRCHTNVHSVYTVGVHFKTDINFMFFLVYLENFLLGNKI